MTPPSGLVALEKAQFGIESSAGSLVAADTVLACEGAGQFAPSITRQLVPDNQGLLVPTAHLDVASGTVFSYRHTLDFEQILLPLETGLLAATVSGAGPYMWVYTPSSAAPDDLASATIEQSIYDGTTRHLEREFGFMTTRRFAISGELNQPAQIEVDMFGRKSQSSTFTAAQSPLTLNRIPSNLFGLFIDTSWANLGTAAKTGILRSFNYEIITGAEPNTTLDQRSDLDMTGIRRGPIAGTVELNYEYDADADAEFDAWVAGTNRFISLEATVGTNILLLQAHIELTEDPTFGEEDGLRTVRLRGTMVDDPVSGNFANVDVTNDIAGPF